MLDEAEFKCYRQTRDSWDSVYIGGGKYRVATVSREEDPTDYGNHSCDPNGKGLMAGRDIAEDEEVTVDYALFSPKSWSMRCNCSSPKCRHIVRGVPD